MEHFDPAALRSFVRGQQEAAQRSQEVRTAKGPPPAHRAFLLAMELWDIDPPAFDRPRTRSERRGIEQVREAWRALRDAGWGQ